MQSRHTYIKKVITQIFLFFNQPYYLFESKKHRLIFSFGTSIFVWFFLCTFGVFGFDYFPLPIRFCYTGVYSLGCLITLLLNLFLLQNYVLEKPTVVNALTWILWLMCCIALSNFLLTTVVFKFEEFSMYTLIKNQIYTLSIGLFITPIMILTHYNYILRKALKEAADINAKILLSGSNRTEEQELITFSSKYKDGKFEIEADQLLYIQSADNYIDIWYKNDNEILHKLIRSTLAYFGKSNSHPALMRCHRSYIININKIKSVKGNAGGFKLIIEGVNHEIPLSRTYKGTVFSILNN